MTSTSSPFTCDDLTVAEHGILSRKVRGNPGVILSSPGAENAGDVLAGLAWLRDRRTDNTAKLEHYQSLTLKQLQHDLGLLDEDETPARMATALVWLETGGSAGEHRLDELGPLDPNDLNDDQQRAVVYALTGVDVDEDEDDDEPDPTPAAVAQEAADDVTGENGMDPTVPPASPYSGR